MRTELFRFVFPEPSNSNVHFEITTVILIGAEKWQQEDKVVAKNELSHSSSQVIYYFISFLVLFTILSKYYSAMFAVCQYSQNYFHGKFFMYTLLPNSLCWQYTIPPGKAYKILRATPASLC